MSLPLPTATSPCKILKCNSEFWSATAGSHSPASDDAPEFCAALRTYALCTRRTARTCRGDLAYHSAVHGIEDLMSQYNCSKDGPTSQPRLRTLPPPSDSQERSDSPEICHYEKSFHKHSAAPNYTHCGLFGDPHLRTFTDRFQTCKVQGAWPLIDNNYLNVQVTNTPVLPGSAATATSKVRVSLGCVHARMCACIAVRMLGPGVKWISYWDYCPQILETFARALSFKLLEYSFLASKLCLVELQY